MKTKKKRKKEIQWTDAKSPLGSKVFYPNKGLIFGPVVC